MSWDTTIKTIKCPCGKGEIKQIVKDDDWGRTQYGSPEICCEECKKKYKLVTLSYSDYKHGDWEAYYLVPKDLKLEYKTKSLGDYNNRWEIGRNDFPYYLILSFKKKWLAEALEELNNKTSVASLQNFASSIAKDKKRMFNSAKIKELRVDVTEALKRYDDYDLTYEVVDKLEQENYNAKDNYRKFVIENGIRIDL